MHAGYWTDGLAHLIAHTFCVSLSLCLQILCLSVSQFISYYLCLFTVIAFLNSHELALHSVDKLMYLSVFLYTEPVKCWCVMNSK